MKKDELTKKIENILNKYYKETGKEIISPIKIYRGLNQKYNIHYKIKFNECRGLFNSNKSKEKN